MKKNWTVALIILLAMGATFTVVKFGVKKTVETSLDQTKNSADHSASGDAQTNAAHPEQAGDVAGTSASGEHSVTGDSKADGTSVNGAHPVNGAAGTSTQVAGEVKKAAPENNCFSFEYRHTKEAQNKDIEDFLDYSNAFPVLHKGVNEKSVCVKVNNKPVAFKMNKNKSQDEVMIGAVVGPESVIKVSYCVGKAACKESCAVKSNRFMDDMMSDAGDEDEFKDSWGDSNSAAHTAQKKELQGKVKELRSVASENKDLAQRSVIRTWETLQKQEWVCKK
jgi:hypothetical protein